MTATTGDFKKAALIYATLVYAKGEAPVADGDVLKFVNIDAATAHAIAEALLAQEIIREGETSGFTIRRLEMDSRTYEWRDQTFTDKSYAKILTLLPPRKGRPFDIEYDPAARELRIFQDAVNERCFMRALECSRAEEALPALADDAKDRSALRKAFSAVANAAVSGQNQAKVAADAWAAVQNAGLENKLDHAKIRNALQQIAWRSKSMKALL